MGSSKKHKEKKDRKKHKKRSRSRERDSHKKSHKSSSRKDKRKSPDRGSPINEYDIPKEKKSRDLEEASTHRVYPQFSIQHEEKKSPTRCREPSPEDEFDIDKLLDSKLSEKVEIPPVKRASKKRIREDILEELRKRQNLGRQEEPVTKLVIDAVPEECAPEIRPPPLISPDRPVEIPFIPDVVIKQEPPEIEQLPCIRIEERSVPNLSLSIADANKLRAKLGLKLLEVEKEVQKEVPSTPEPQPSPSKSCLKKLRVKSESKPIDISGDIPEQLESLLSHSKSGSKKSRVKSEPKPLDVSGDFPEPPEPQFSHSKSSSKKSRAKNESKPIDVSGDIPETSEPQLSLSISDTNKLRAKLGLKPLDVGGDIPGITDENGMPPKPTEVFVKTENIREVKKSEALREKLRVHKEKRAIEEKLRKTKTIAESDSEEESAADWVHKHQKLSVEKERAEKRAKMLEEMDAEFGVGALMEEEIKKSKAYTSQHLRGLTIGHGVDSFKEGTPVILTLKDKGVLEEEEDVLENVNIIDNEKYAKNVEVKKKKPDYQPYEEPEFDEFGILKKKNMLSKYDEEIEGEKKKTFKIGASVTRQSYSTREQELELIRMKLRQQNKISLEMPEMQIVNEYLTPADMVQFKKPKKKKKKVLKQPLLKADDLITGTMDEAEKDFGSRKRRRVLDDAPYSTDTHEIEVPEIEEDLTDVAMDEDQGDKEMYSALNKAKKLMQRKIMSSAPEKVIEILNKTNAPESDSAENLKGANIELNSVAEFCRTLGEIPTYGMSGNRDEEADDLMDLERELLEEKQKQELEAQNRGAWNEVDIDEKPAEISVRENEPILEEEPDINLGVAGALNLAMKKGYLDKDGKKAANTNKESKLQAQSYTIEEKFYEDDKFGKRDRYTGPTQEFREKNNYKPDVKLEYIDDSGRLLTAKEAFRYLSHKFHGKGPGKNKVDKRMKKLEQDTRLKQMSSTDTPLNTVKLLQAKQKETQSPYIVLSGGNKTLTQTMISKTKL